MADQADVENALVPLVSTALYPKGTDAGSVPGPACRIYRGWPNAGSLDADLAAGRINVTVFPGVGPGRNTFRYTDQWVGSPSVPTLRATLSGRSVSFVGTAGAGQIAGILVDGLSYAYRIQAFDTPALVAANLASLAREHFIVQLAGDTITIAGSGDLLARVVADAPALRELRRQEQEFRINCWCPSPIARDATSAAIDNSMAGMRFIVLSDGTCGRLLYHGTTVFDQSKNARLYRRDLIYSVEYPTTLSATLPAMLFGSLGLNAARFTV